MQLWQNAQVHAMADLCKDPAVYQALVREMQSTRWYAAGTQYSACNKEANKERKRIAQQPEQNGQAEHHPDVCSCSIQEVEGG